MSEIAGKMAIQVGARCLERKHGGKGILLGGVPGVRRGKVAILGAGSVGLSAAKVAHGMGAQVSILDTNVLRLAYIDDVFNGALTTLAADADNIAIAISEADLVVGAVLLPGAKAPRLVTRDQLALMGTGSVVVDVAVDQGGCFETTRATTHESPTYVVDGILHYGVSNMPGAVPQTSTYALTNVTTPYALLLAKYGALEAAKTFPALALGLNSLHGHIVCEPVAEAVGMPFVPWKKAV
jgi:alanine dehydrogenase